MAAALVPGSVLLARTIGEADKPNIGLVAAGSDREGKARSVGVSSTTYKVLTAQTSGAMFAMEQTNAKKGSPSRYLHFNHDEVFYVLDEEYIVETGAERLRMKAGDWVLGPRCLPHAWAFVGESGGRMLLSNTPAGKIEEFFNNREKLGIGKGASATTRDAETMRLYGMDLVGPSPNIDRDSGAKMQTEIFPAKPQPHSWPESDRAGRCLGRLRRPDLQARC